MRNEKENIIVDKTFHFALEIIDYTEKLRSLKKFEMASQLFGLFLRLLGPVNEANYQINQLSNPQIRNHAR